MKFEYALNSEKLKNNRITIIAYDNESYKAVTKEFSDLSSAQKVTYYGEYAKNFEERLCDHFGFVYQKPSSAPTVIHNISYPENLIPRRDMLNKLDKEFKSHKCVVVSGIGSSGKTSLAYLYAKEQKFNNIAWVIVNGKIEDVFVDKIAGLIFNPDDYIKFVQIPDREYKLDNIKKILFGISGKNFLVLDINTNNEEIKQEIETELYNYLPAENWETLVLTRTHPVSDDGFFDVVEMDKMAEDDAQELFKSNWKRKGIVFTKEQLAEITKELHLHPLLIEQTAIVFSKNGHEKTAEQIIEKIKGNSKIKNERTKAILGSLVAKGKTERQDIYTYLINLCKVENLSKEEIDFLAVYVTWSEEPIAYEVISTLLPDTDETLDSLVEKGIISRNDFDQYSIHGLMADVIREQINISKFDYSDYLVNIYNILRDDIKKVTLHKYSKCISSSFINYGICGHIVLFGNFLNNLLANNDVILYQLPMPELYHLANEFEKDAKPYDLAGLYNSIARVENFKNNLSDAKMHYEKALEVIASAEENGALFMKGGLLQNLAMLEEKLGDTDSAKKHYEEAVEIFRKLPKTPKYLNSLATTLGNLADLEKKLGETDSAKKHYEEAIEIRRQLPEKPDHLYSLSIDINNLATLEEKLGDTDSAKTHYEEAVEVNRKLLELTETPKYLDNLAASLHNLADLEDDLGDTNSAKKHLEEGLEISRRSGNEEDIRFFEEILSYFP